MITRALVLGAVLWPLVLGAALWDRVAHPAPDRSAWAAIVYFAASHVCHQQPARSFHTHGEKWPVCARCAGLYLAAPFGAAWFLRRRRGSTEQPGFSPADTVGRQPDGAGLVQLLLLAAVPTVLTIVWEWGGMGTPAHAVRFATALPLGAAIAWVLLAVTHPRHPAMGAGIQ